MFMYVLSVESFVFTHSCIYLFIHSRIISLVCLTTGPQPLPKPVLHTCDLVLLFQFTLSSLFLNAIQ